MHYNKVIQNGNVNDVVNESVVDGVQYIDEKPIKGSLNPATSGGVYEAIKGSVIPANVDVIKWSDVLAVEDNDYSEFTARIAANIAAGIAPVVLDDVNGGAVAVLDNINAGGALFRTPANCDERNVVYTDYVITDVAASRTTRTRNVLFKNASNGYATNADGFVEVSNNRNGVYTYSGNTGGNSLDFLADFDNNTAISSVRFSDINPPNFAVKIVSTAATDGTVTVYKKQNGLYTPLMPSVAGGTTVEAGKTYQLTCVGDCWTLAEFEEPAQGMLTKIGGRMYKVVKIGNLYWMAENLDFNFSGLVFGQSGTSETEPRGNYYDNNSTSYGKYGILYNWIAAKYLEDNKDTLIPGWHVPTAAEWDALATAVGGASIAGTTLKSTMGWLSGAGTDDYGFSALPAGIYTGSFSELGSRTVFWTSTVLNGWIHYRILNNAADITASFGSEKELQYSVRLVKDV